MALGPHEMTSLDFFFFFWEIIHMSQQDLCRLCWHWINGVWMACKYIYVMILYSDNLFYPKNQLFVLILHYIADSIWIAYTKSLQPKKSSKSTVSRTISHTQLRQKHINSTQHLPERRYCLLIRTNYTSSIKFQTRPSRINLRAHISRDTTPGSPAWHSTLIRLWRIFGERRAILLQSIGFACVLNCAHAFDFVFRKHGGHPSRASHRVWWILIACVM